MTNIAQGEAECYICHSTLISSCIFHTNWRQCFKYRYECYTIKYSMRDGVEWQIQHEAKSSAVFATRPTQSDRAAQVYGSFTDLLGLHGRITRMIDSAFSRFSKQSRFDALEL